MDKRDVHYSKSLSAVEQIATDSDISPPRGNPFPVVGIGASAGGLEAFGQLLSALPVDTGMAFVLVQHLDPVHESLLPELLAAFTLMPVVSVTDGLKIEPDHVFVIPPNSTMELKDGTLRLSSREPGLHLPVDIFSGRLQRFRAAERLGSSYLATLQTGASACGPSRRNAASHSRKVRPRRVSGECPAAQLRPAPSTMF